MSLVGVPPAIDQRDEAASAERCRRRRSPRQRQRRIATIAEPGEQGGEAGDRVAERERDERERAHDRGRERGRAASPPQAMQAASAVIASAR